MKSMLKILLIFAVISSVEAKVACPTDRDDYFCITPEMTPDSLVQIQDFYSVPVEIMSHFSEEIAVAGYPVVLAADWESPYFGAGVSLYEEQFRLMILGGMTRVKGMTKDAYAAIVCHEIGHIIGGSPFQTIPFAEWS